MVRTGIPRGVDKDILELNEKGVPPAEIAIALRADGVTATATMVRRRVQELTGRLPTVDLEQEVWAGLSASLVDLEQAELRLAEIEQHTFQLTLPKRINDEGPTAAQLALSHAVVVKRTEVILKKHKLLQFALTERLRRREAELRIEAVVEARRANAGPHAFAATAEPQPQALPAGSAEAPMLPTSSAARALITNAGQTCEGPAGRGSDGSSPHSA
jgi:hypothetical protein